MHTSNKQNLLSRAPLKDTFLSGIKNPDGLQVGVEWEKIGVYKDTGGAIRYFGEKGVEAILKALVQKFAWEPIYSGEHITELRKADAVITLEPGGQIELSGRKAPNLSENARELCHHLAEIKEVSEPLGIAWLGVGMQPVSSLGEIEWVPKERYGIMREAFANNGALSHCMMKQTAATQVSLDFVSEEDAIQKLRLAFALTPFLSALFANSPISEGKLNGFYSRRNAIWHQTAPDRTGIIWEAFEDGFNFDGYVDYLLKAPLLFIVRENQWIAGQGISFGDFIKNGFHGHWATPADWNLHLTTIFTEARLKHFIEIRSMDCQRQQLGMAAPALLKGLFYDETSQKQAWKILWALGLDEIRRLFNEMPKMGLHARTKGATAFEIASQLIQLAEEGLGRLQSRGKATASEVVYLAPLRELVIEKQKVPADVLRQCFESCEGSEEKIKAIIRCAAL